MKILGVGLGILALSATAVWAVFGGMLADFVPSVSGNGRAVAFDGSTLYYTRYPDAGMIYKTDPTNSPAVAMPTAPALQWGALSWDSTNNQLWGARYGDAIADFYTIDEVTGAGAFMFNFVFPAGESCYPNNVNNPDGLAYDATDNTLWISDDAATKVYHVDTSGTVLGSFTVPNGKCNTGIAADGQYLWLAVQSGADAGPHDIYRVDKSNPTVVLSTIPFGPGPIPGPEDIELDLVTYANQGKCALWSNQFGAPNHLIAWELEDNIKPECGLRLTLNPEHGVNPIGEKHRVTATLMDGTMPLVGTMVQFQVMAGGPNAGEMSDPGECDVDPNCMTDPAGQTSWTYLSNGTPGQDIIMACFVTTTGEQMCVRAIKDWVDRTPPEAACVETVNPHGKTVPPAGSTTLPGPKGGQNEDGYYELRGRDNLPGVMVMVMDMGSGVVFGPYPAGTRIKYTEANGATPTSKKIGSTNGQAGAVSWHITGTGDAAVYAVDAAGNQSQPVACLVPPPPK